MARALGARAKPGGTRVNAQHDPTRPDRVAVERGRIEFLVRRDGIAEAAQWVHRTVGIYRRAVLNRHHHASRDEYRVLR